ncbi:MAG: hypothetical protein ACI4EV_01055 [Lachnospiraceae bacterium]
MKYGKILVLVLTILVLFTGCSTISKETINITEKIISFDYDSYSNPGNIEKRGNNVYEGKVTKVYFDTLNTSTMMPDKNGERGFEHYGKADVKLYTIYEIEVTKTYKGDKKEVRKIRVEGGTNEYGIDEQVKVLNKAGIDYRVVPSEVTTLVAGKTYLFVTTNSKNGFDGIYNPQQFAFCSDNSNLCNGINYGVMQEYLSGDEFANPQKVSFNYIDDDFEMAKSPQAVVDAAENIYEGTVYSIQFYLLDPETLTSVQPDVDDMKRVKLYTVYSVDVRKIYKGENLSSFLIYVEGANDEYDVDAQLRLLASNGITTCNVIKNATKLKIGEKYLFATNWVKDSFSIGKNQPGNPAQFAFCSDNSNAPGGVDYKMMKEYLEK